MLYRDYGTTGFKVSVLGFGAMRLPMTEINGEKAVDQELSIAMMHKAFENGVNYIDTAYMYCKNQSEIAVGKALTGWRDKVKVATKLPLGNVKEESDFERILEEQLTKLDVDTIDFYHFHGLRSEEWDAVVAPLKLVEKMQKAKDDGRIGHMSCSFHDKPEVMKQFVDMGVFSSLLCQYNLIDRSNEESIAYAREKGVGVAVMGPVGGGRLDSPRDYLDGALPGKASVPEMALRFVLSNPNVSVALSGMSTMQQVEENLATASRAEPLAEQEAARISEIYDSRKKLAELYCTGCEYCMPCPNDVNIAKCFQSMINHKVYGFTDRALQQYRAIGDKWMPGKRADACVDCGECEPKCPQNIPIRKQLKEVDAELGPHVEKK